MTMYVRRGKEKADNTGLSMSSMSKAGIGTIITLIPSDQEYCLGTDCYYAIRFEVKNVVNFEYFTIIRDRNPTVRFDQTFALIEGLRDEDLQVFEFTSVASDPDQNWRFNLVPLEGNPDMYIHFGEQPKSLSGYHFNTTTESQEEILVTAQEMKELNFTGKTAYVALKSSTRSSLYLQVAATNGVLIKNLIPNVPVTGEADSGEIVNYYLYFNLSIPEKIEAFVRLQSISGDNDLYIKHCLDNKTCLISKEDIE